MNEKPPHSRGSGDGTTVVVAAVLIVFVVLFGVLILGGLLAFYFMAPSISVRGPAPPSAVTIVQDGPAEIQEDIGETVTEMPVEADNDSIAATTDAVPEEQVDGVGVEIAPEEAEPVVMPKAEPAEQPPDTTPPADETVEGGTPAPVDETAAEDMPPAEKEVPETGSYQALPQAFERVGVKADEGAHASVTFSGRTCESAIWAQPDEDEGVSQVSYMLDGKFATLRGTAGISDVGDEARPGDQTPAAVFRIYGDGNLLWESDPLTGFGAAQQFEVEIKGIEVLALMAESSSSSELSRFAWGDVELKATNE